MLEGTVALSDGRAIGYAEYGVADGIPIFDFHGLPGGRFYNLDEEALQQAGARLITLERPGFGLSSPLPGRVILDWPADVAQVADHFGCERFAVFGYSAGAPNAVACAYALPERVAVCGLAAGMGPYFDNPQFDAFLPPEQQALLPIARDDRDTAIALVREFMKPEADGWASDPDAFFVTFVDSWPEEIRDAFRAERELWMNVLGATYDNGVDAVVDEVASTMGPWDFDPGAVRIPVRAWHGTADHIPLDAIRYVVDAVPDGQLTEYPDEGHALDHAHHADWLATLTAW